MSRHRSKVRGNFDWITLWILLSIMTIGWLMIYAVEYQDSIDATIFNFSTSYGKQLVWIGLAMVVLTASIIINPVFWKVFSYPILLLACISLVLILFFGIEIKGSQSWFTFGAFSVQPGELAKFPALIALASFLSFHKTDLTTNKGFFSSLALIGLPVGLIMLQPDAGMAITYSALLVVLYREGSNPIWFIALFAIVMLFIASIIFDSFLVILALLLIGSILIIFHFPNRHPWFLAFSLSLTLAILIMFLDWHLGSMVLMALFFLTALVFLLTTREQRLVFLYGPAILLASLFSFSTTYTFDNVLKPHQQDRINVWLQPSLSDPHGSRYNVLQSQLAIGSGGLTGKGFLNGTLTKLNYVPEQNTDFIFVTVGEEQGFLGGAAVIILYAILISRIFLIGEKMKGVFERAYAYGVGGFLFVHFMINIGMTMGLMPVIGIPLPFMSYGGSSLMVFTLMMGVLLRLDYERRIS